MNDKSTETEQEDLPSENGDERKNLYLDKQQNCLQDKFKIVFIVSLFFLALSLVAVASILAWAYVEREHMINEKAQLAEPTRLYTSPTATKSDLLSANKDIKANKKESNEKKGEERSTIPDGNANMHLYRVYDAITKGAVCLDGTPPAYYLRPGKGLGLNRWIIHFNGGAWCFDEKSCLERSRGSLGSTKHLPAAPPVIQGINSPNMQLNPDFYDWNLVWIVYCDGASFTGDRADPVVVNGENIFFRGKRVLDAVIGDLQNRGISNAEGIILTGSSAGSMTAMFAVDRLAEQLPSVPMHVLSDAGYFIETQQMGGKNIGAMFKKVYEMQKSSAGLNKDCINSFGVEMGWKCFLPQHTFKFIKHPVFVLNAAYDVWALLYFVGIDCKFPTVATPAGRKKRGFIGSRDYTKINVYDSVHARKQKRDISGFEILPYFRAEPNNGRGATSTFEEKNEKKTDEKRHEIPEKDGVIETSNQEKRNFDPQLGSLDLYNALQGLPSQEYLQNSRMGPSENDQESTGSTLHLNIDKGEGGMAGAGTGARNEFEVPILPISINGAPTALANERQEEMNLNPLASSVNTLSNVANNVQKNNMDTNTIGLLNEVFKKLTKLMPKKNANGTLPKNQNNTSGSAKKGKPNGPSLMENQEHDKVAMKKNANKSAGAKEVGNKNEAHGSALKELIKQARKIEQAMKNKDNKNKETKLSKSPTNIDNAKNRNTIDLTSKNKRSSIVKEYINILRSDPPECTENQMIKVMQYRTAMLQATAVVSATPSAGFFLVSCIQHSLSLFDETWTGVTVKQKSIQQAFGDWYYGRGTNHYNIDGVYPSNPSCP